MLHFLLIFDMMILTANYITSNCYKEVVKYFSHNFGIRFNLIVYYVYESDLLIYENFKVNSNIQPLHHQNLN